MADEPSVPKGTFVITGASTGIGWPVRSIWTGSGFASSRELRGPILAGARTKKAGQCDLSRRFLFSGLQPCYFPASLLSFFALASFFRFLPAR